MGGEKWKGFLRFWKCALDNNGEDENFFEGGRGEDFAGQVVFAWAVGGYAICKPNEKRYT